MSTLAKRLTAVTIGLVVTLLGWAMLGLGQPWFLPFIWLAYGLPAFTLGYKATAFQSTLTILGWGYISYIHAWEIWGLFAFFLMPGVVIASTASFIRFCLEDL